MTAMTTWSDVDRLGKTKEDGEDREDSDEAVENDTFSTMRSQVGPERWRCSARFRQDFGGCSSL